MSTIKPFPRPDEPPRDPDDAAAWWLVRRRSARWSRTHQRRLEAWLSADPGHPEALARAEQAWEAAGLFAAEPSILSVRERALARPDRSIMHRRMAVAASVVCAVALAAVGAPTLARLDLPALPWSPELPEVERHQTVRGSRSTLQLADGSRVDLNGGSELEVVFSRRARALRLVKGEAWFDVAKDPKRPFTVEAQGRTITDIGTAFNVRVEPSSIQVAVAEGKVGVGARNASPFSPSSWAEVDAGQRLTVDEQGSARLETVNVAALGEWRHGRIQFDNVPLAEALAEMNRYTPTPMRLADPAMGTERISGVFFTDGSSGFVAALASLFDLTPQPRNGETILVRRPGGPVEKMSSGG